MRIIILIALLSFSFQLFPQSDIDRKKLISFQSNELSSLEILQNIEKQSGISINYSPGQLKNNCPVILKDKILSVGELLELISMNDNLEVVINQDNIFLVKYDQNNVIKKFISGFVRDKLSGEILIGANIRFKGSDYGAVTDENGYFSLKNNDLLGDLLISFVGYSSIEINIKNFKVGFLGDIFLIPSVHLKTVIIDDSLRKTDPEIFDFKNEISTTKLSNGINKFGINDAFNELQMKAGINKLNDFQGGLSIDGFSPGENIYLLDGIRIFEPNHSFGLFSAFSSNSVNNVMVFTNFVPPKYDGAGTSVFDFRTLDGNFSTLKYEIGASNTAFNSHFSMPVRKYKTSVVADFRQSLIGLYLNSFIPEGENIEFNKFNFNDLNIKITHNIKSGSKLNLMFYHGADKLKIINGSKYSFKSDNNFKWSNQALGLNWNYLFKSGLNYNLGISNSNYNNLSFSTFSEYSDDAPSNYLSVFSSTKLNESTLKNDFNYYKGKSKYNFGANISFLNINPALGGNIISEENFTPNIENTLDSSAMILSTYFNQNLTIYSKFELDYGLKSGYYKSGGFPIWYIDPSVRLIFKLARRSFINVGYSSSSKYLHSLGSYAVGIPSMIWTLSDKTIPLSKLKNYYLTLMFKYFKYKFKADLYYKTLDNIIMYNNLIDSYNPLSATGVNIPEIHDEIDFRNNISVGKSYAYGMNISSEFEIDKLKGGLDFSINRNKQKFQDINLGRYFNGKYDVLYSAGLNLSYELKKWNFNLVYKIHSGQVFTLPEYIYKDEYGNEILDFNTPNNRRMGNYQSLDLAANYHRTLNKYTFKFSLGLSNTYNHFNPVYTYISRFDDRFIVKEVSGLPLFPYISFAIRN